MKQREKMKELTDDDKRSMSKAGIDIYNAIRDKKIEEERKEFLIKTGKEV